jgi:subtilisin family serine protease
LALLWAAPASAQNRIIVRTTLGQAGLQSLLNTVCLLQTCNVVGPLDDSPQPQLFLVTTSLNPTTLINLLSGLLGIVDAELDQLLSLIGGLNVVGTPPSALTDSSQIQYYGTTVRNGYVNQPATTIVRVSAAQSQFNVDGSGITVADIDTGVDPNHPALAGVLAGQGTNLPSCDFTRRQPNNSCQPGASELNDLSQSDFPTYPPPQCSTCSPATVNQSSAAILDQSSAAILDNNSKYAAFGHGTMVLGVIHLVAPKAMLLPLKAFHSDGTGYLSDVLSAIYWAVVNHANVINMSFDFTSYSQELATALNYASQQTLICGASAGNEGQQIVVYPAGLQSAVMGVASTNDNDVRSSFSNYGTAVVWVAAPGEGIVTTYPFNTYAAGWGTSFSAPFVSGTSALLHNKQSTNEAQAAAAIGHAHPLPDPSLGHGRLDIVQALQSISPADFSISTSPTTATVTAGQVATYTATLSPINGFNQTITLGCSGLPSAATCTVTPSTVTLNGTSPATATVTVQTTARAATAAGFVWSDPFSGPSAGRLGWILAWVAGLLVWATLCHLGMATRPGRGLAAAVGLVTFSLALYSCGGNSSGPSPGTPGPASATLSSLTLAPTAVNGGVRSNGLVTLSGAAPSGGAVVSLSSSNPSVATVPASVTVSAGASSTAFQVSTASVSSQTTVTISASYSGSQQSATLTVVPANSALALASLALSPTTVSGGVPSNGLVTLSGTAPSGGAVVSLSSSNPSVATVPASVTVPAGASSAAFQVATTSVSSQTTVTISGSYSGSQQSAVLTVIPATSAPTLASLTVNPTSVNGGNSSTGTVTLSSAAPSGGVVVSLASSNTSLAPVPASVAIPAGATSATFGVKTSAVSSTTTVTITGSYAGVQQSALLTVTPAQSGPSLTSLILNPTSVTGGSPSTGTVALNGPAPAGGAMVSLSSSNSAVAVVPSSVTIAAGTASASFMVTTTAVTSATTSTISASYNGVTQTDVLTVRPPGTPAGTYKFTVTGTTGTLSHSTSPTLVVN